MIDAELYHRCAKRAVNRLDEHGGEVELEEKSASKANREAGSLALSRTIR